MRISCVGSLADTVKLLHRCPDLPASMSAKKEAWKVLLVIEGPQEPHTYDHMLQPTIDFLVQHDPGGEPLMLCHGTV